jgi:hypothetical protein
MIYSPSRRIRGGAGGDISAGQRGVRIDLEGDGDQRQDKNDDESSHGPVCRGRMRRNRSKKWAKNGTFIWNAIWSLRSLAFCASIGLYVQLCFSNAVFCHEFCESRVRLAGLRHMEFGRLHETVSPIGARAQSNNADRSYPVFNFHNLGMGSALGGGLLAAPETSPVP